MGKRKKMTVEEAVARAMEQSRQALERKNMTPEEKAAEAQRLAAKAQREEEAVNRWVATFIPIQTKIIEKLMKYEPEQWHEVTAPVNGVTIFVPKWKINGWVISRLDDDMCKVKLDIAPIEIPFDDHEAFLRFQNTNTVNLHRDEFEITAPRGIPKEGTMWSFSNPEDVQWLEQDDGLEDMSDWYFRIFKHDEFGYFFGIDCIYHDMYVDYWQPLYGSRGLNWHKVE